MLKGILLFTLIIQWSLVHASTGVKFVDLVESKDGVVPPALDLTDINSQAVVVDKFTDEVTLIHFWATWCVPCVKELPELQMISEKYRDRGLRVIAIAADSHESVKEFIKKQDMRLYVVIDQYGSAMRNYKVGALPASYIVGRKGKLQFTATGPVNWLSGKTDRLISNLIDKPLVAN